jgi:hypothetical protein
MDKLSLLKDEYLHLQSAIESFDERALTIKAWSVTLAAGVSALSPDQDWVLLVAAVSAILFWLLEGYWKTFQDAHHARIRELEMYFEDESRDIVPMQISRNWYDAYHGASRSKLLGILFWPHVSLPHSVIALVAVVVYLLRLSA